MKVAAFYSLFLGMSFQLAISQSNVLWTADYESGVENSYTSKFFPRINVSNDTIRINGVYKNQNTENLQIISYDLNGNLIHEQLYGLDPEFHTRLTDYKIDAHGNVYLMHTQEVGFVQESVFLQKYDSSGELLWIHAFLFSEDTSYYGFQLGLVNDTCVFALINRDTNLPQWGDDVVFTESSLQLHAFHTNGAPLWSRNFDPATEFNFISHGFFAKQDTAYYFSGNRLGKISESNELVMNMNTGLQGGVGMVQVTTDGNLIISSSGRYRLTKMTTSGQVIWTYLHPTNLPSNVCCDGIQSMIQDEEGNIYISGKYYGVGSNGDVLTLKFNSAGALIWENSYTHGINNYESGLALFLKNGNLYVAGGSQNDGVGSHYDYFLLKIDTQSGAYTGGYRYDSPNHGNDISTAIHVLDDNQIVITGLSQYQNEKYDWTTQMLSDIVLQTEKNFLNDDVIIFPNPLEYNSTLNIYGDDLNNLSVFDLQGKLVYHLALDKSTSNHSANLSSIPSGVYVVKTETTQGETITFKLVK